MSEKTVKHASVEKLVEQASNPRIAELEDRLRKANLKIESLSLEKSYHKRLIKKQSWLLKKHKAIEEAGSPRTKIIKPKTAWSTEATVFMVASDWHMEERVDPAAVNWLNEYDTSIAARRAQRFFQTGLRLTQIIQQDVRVNTIVLPLLGDFITNQIHEDNAESNQELPVNAVIMAQNHIASGIQFLLDNSECSLVIPCHSGNHGRTTDRVHHAGEHGHSLEFFMYKNLEAHFAGNKRVQFLVSPGYHSYMDVYGMRIRLHHGHAIQYRGGVGGIYIPVNKAIAQWNKAKPADLDVFGHFHQMRDGSNFVSNGSLIGWSTYSVRIKADFEPPRQAFFVVDNKHGKTCTWPIFAEKPQK